MNDEDRLRGTLERIIYSDEETGFCIGEVQPSEGGGRITVSGKLPGVQCGETLDLEGSWYQHTQYGRQFKVERCEATLPSSVNGIRRYLGSGLIAGIGKVYADKIVARFGAETLKVISQESGRLREVPGIGRERAKAIKAAWEEQRTTRDVMIFLHTYGVTAGQSLRLVKRYGGEVLTILKSNPYQVADEVDGIGFKTADKIALNLGIASNGRPRLRAGVLFVLSEAEGEGHTAVSREDLMTRSRELLDAEEEGVGTAIDALLEERTVAVDAAGRIQSASLARAEERLAKSLMLLAQSPSGLPAIKVGAALDWSEERAGFTFAAEQREGLRAALEAKVAILTGGPGTGKTTILRALVRILTAKKIRVVLASPTGRAAQRLAESAGSAASTVHRLLEFDPAKGRFERNENRPLKAGFVVVDEASMLDTRLAASLIAAIPPEAHLLLVGDADQLPSVGAGNVLRDLVASGRFPVARLSQIFRQGKGSEITRVAHGILGGQMLFPDGGSETGETADVRFVHAPEALECRDAVLQIVDDLQKSGLRDPLDFQVLVPMHRGSCGVGELNRLLQECFPGGGDSIAARGGSYRTGDKVIQLRNNYDLGIFNGDVGRITAIDPVEGRITVDFGLGPCEIEKAAQSDLSLAYALTIHKSQGSEYPVVIIPLVMQHFVMLRRNLLYTAITRGRKKVWLVGDPRAFRTAVREAGGNERVTGLRERVEELVGNG